MNGFAPRFEREALGNSEMVYYKMVYFPSHYICTWFFLSFFFVFIFTFFTEAEMWPRSVSRFRGVLIGIAIGSGLVGLLVTWTIEGIYTTTAKQRIRPGKK